MQSVDLFRGIDLDIQTELNITMTTVLTLSCFIKEIYYPGLFIQYYAVLLFRKK